MEPNKYTIFVVSDDQAIGSVEAWEAVCRYLLKRYSEESEKNEGFGIYKSFYGGAGGKGLFNTSTEE